MYYIEIVHKLLCFECLFYYDIVRVIMFGYTSSLLLVVLDLYNSNFSLRNFNCSLSKHCFRSGIKIYSNNFSHAFIYNHDRNVSLLILIV